MAWNNKLHSIYDNDVPCYSMKRKLLSQFHKYTEKAVEQVRRTEECGIHH